MKKKIVLTVLLGMLAAVAVWCVVMDVKNIISRVQYLDFIRQNQADLYSEQSKQHILLLINDFFNLLIVIICIAVSFIKILSFWVNLNILTKTAQYRYEDYLHDKQLKTEQKKQEKKEKLLKKLSKYE